MKIFEFHFNPKASQETIFESLCHDPENIYEKRLGSLCLAGFLDNALPQNQKFLSNLSKTIKEQYYKNSSLKQERALRDTLKKANQHLEKTAKEGDVSWLGNLNFAVTTFKNFDFNFTRVGEMKIYMLRKGQIIDIDQKLKYEEIEPYPLKIFGNIVSGKLAEGDIVMVLTKEAAGFFLKQGFLLNIAKSVQSQTKQLKSEERAIKEIFNSKKEDLSKISGVCLLMLLSKETAAKERETLVQTRTLGSFSFKKMFALNFKKLSLPKLNLKMKKPLAKLPGLKIPSIKIALPKTHSYKPKLSFKKPKISFKIPKLSQTGWSVLALIILLLIGFFIFQKQEEIKLNNYRIQLGEIAKKTDQAQSYLAISSKNSQARKKAFELYQEAWQNISPVLEISSSFPRELEDKFSELEKNIEKNLYELSGLTVIENPELIFEFKAREYVPQKITLLNSLYFFSPYSENIFKIDSQNQGQLLSINKKISYAAPLQNSILFFSSPSQVLSLENDQIQELSSLELPYPEFQIRDLANYLANFYFLDSQNAKIVKYPSLTSSSWDYPQIWLDEPNVKNFKSIAVDGSVWLLSKDNSIEKYYSGKHQSGLKINVFPEPKEFSQIFTSSQHS